MSSELATIRELVGSSDSPLLEVEQEGLRKNWRELLPNLQPEHERLLAELTRRIKINFVRSMLNAVEIGRLLCEARDFFNQYYNESFWKLWIAEELKSWSDHFSMASAINYMNIYMLYQRNPSLSELKISMRVCYLLARRTVPQEVIKVVEAKVRQEGSITYEEARTIIQEHQEESTRNTYGFSETVWGLIRTSALARQSTELRKLANLPEEMQLKVIEVLMTNPSMKVREALSYLHQETLPAFEEVIPLKPTVVPFQLDAKSGKNWRDLISAMPGEEFDLIVCEPPLANEWLDNYGSLMRALEAALKPAGRLLLVAGQQNVMYLGYYQMNYAPELKAGWLFYLRARAGESKRVLGLNIAASYIPLAFFYKPPFEGLVNLTADMLSYDPEVRGLSNSTTLPTYTLKSDASESSQPVQIQRSDINPARLNSMEDCIQYYAERLMRDKASAHVLYFAPVASKRIGNAFVDGVKQAAIACNAKKLSLYVGL